MPHDRSERIILLNSFVQPQRVLVLGGGSEIALEIVKQLASPSLQEVILAGPNPESLGRAAASLDSSSRALITCRDFDAADTDSHDGFFAELFKEPLDVVILAFGVLGEQEAFESDPRSAVRVAKINYLGGLSAGLLVADHMMEQGYGRIVVLSSVAGLRARRSNFVYGSTKAGLDVFAQGLADATSGTGVLVHVVRPGFVRTRMTEHLSDKPLATDPSRVAADTVRGMKRGAHTIYSPPAVKYLMGALRVVPRSVFRRLPD